MAGLQKRQQFRQEIGREGRNDAELQFSFEQPALMAREIDEVAGGRQHFIAALGDQDADLRQCCVARPAVDKLDVELLLQFPNLHR